MLLMNNVADLLHARLEAIELALSRVAIAITESEGPMSDELRQSIAHFRELEKPDLDPKRKRSIAVQ
jgi:hypothetical protein